MKRLNVISSKEIKHRISLWSKCTLSSNCWGRAPTRSLHCTSAATHSCQIGEWLFEQWTHSCAHSMVRKFLHSYNSDSHIHSLIMFSLWNRKKMLSKGGCRRAVEHSGACLDTHIECPTCCCAIVQRFLYVCVLRSLLQVSLSLRFSIAFECWPLISQLWIMGLTH